VQHIITHKEVIGRAVLIKETIYLIKTFELNKWKADFMFKLSKVNSIVSVSQKTLQCIFQKTPKGTSFLL